ncbi:MAG: hypothetical protein M5U34_18255 [Chloroflexi bacterium]|nr:hypothetical protein [Chloroflexota bacterium]
MPYGETPWVRQGKVVTATGIHLHIDTPTWFAWLETISSFCYNSSQGGLRLTAHREKRRQQTYWYGYARNAGKLHNIYLGRTERLTQAHLDRACRQARRQSQSRPEEKGGVNEADLMTVVNINESRSFPFVTVILDVIFS